MTREAYLLAGPTASGKSALAASLAREMGAAILSADSMNVYRGMDIGTAKPSAAERAEFKMGGIDVVTPAEEFSSGAWLRAAAEWVKRIPTDQPIIIVGGTGLYFSALLRGLDRKWEKPPPVYPVIKIDRAVVRARIAARLDAMFMEGLEAEKNRLHHEYPLWSRTASLAIGYREGDTREKILTRTCQLAKRQDTWFRHQATPLYVEPTIDSVRACWREHGPWKVTFLDETPRNERWTRWTKLLLESARPSETLESWREAGFIDEFPELRRLIGCRQDPAWHPEGDAWEHTKLCLDAFARHRTGDEEEDLIVGLAVVCHDLGKPATTAFDPRTGHIRSIGHDAAGAEPTRAFLRRLTKDESFVEAIVPLVENHMQPFAFWKAKAGDAAIRRLRQKVGSIERLLRVSICDDEGRLGEVVSTSGHGEDVEYLRAADARLRAEESKPAPLFSGRDLIALGYKPSPQFSQWIDRVYEAQLNGAFSDAKGALDYFKELVGQ